MALILLFLGVIVLITGVEGTWSEFVQLLGQDIPGFIIWAGAIALIGAIGYIPEFEGVSNALLALVLIVIFLGHQGIWANLQAVLEAGSRHCGDTRPGAQPARASGAAAKSDHQPRQRLILRAGPARSAPSRARPVRSHQSSAAFDG